MKQSSKKQATTVNKPKDAEFDPYNEIYQDHPLYPVFMGAIHQAMFGKGERHGGDKVPFGKQPIFHYAEMHGRGFLTGQATKKIEEAASLRNGEAFETEIFGALVYAAASVIEERKNPENYE